MNETRQLAQFVTKVRFDDLPGEAIDKAKELVLDQLGCELAASTLPWNKAVYKYVKDNGGKPESTVVNYGLKTTVENAVFANATFGHGFEIDDLDLVSLSHPGCVVIPAALAVGEREMIDGREFILAVVAGYDVFSRVGAAARSTINRWFHPTAVFGPFGAAAAAGKILGLPEEQVLHSFGISASQCSGIMEYSETGGSVKRLHAGIAAHGGVRAAFLAQRGLTGPTAAIEGKKGVCQAFADEYFIDELTSELGKAFRIMWTGVKPYCCCGGNHTAIDAVQKIMDEHHLTAKEAEKITVGLASARVETLGTIVEPQDMVGAQFSLRFNVALRLVKGGNGFRDYSEANLRDPEIKRVARKIELVVNQDLDKNSPAGAEVAITKRDGTVYKERVDFAKGTVKNPMSKEEIQDKFRELASNVLTQDRVEKLIETVEGLEKLNNICDLTLLLTA